MFLSILFVAFLSMVSTSHHANTTFLERNNRNVTFLKTSTVRLDNPFSTFIPPPKSVTFWRITKDIKPKFIVLSERLRLKSYKIDLLS